MSDSNNKSEKSKRRVVMVSNSGDEEGMLKSPDIRKVEDGQLVLSVDPSETLDSDDHSDEAMEAESLDIKPPQSHVHAARRDKHKKKKKELRRKEKERLVHRDRTAAGSHDSRRDRFVKEIASDSRSKKEPESRKESKSHERSENRSDTRHVLDKEKSDLRDKLKGLKEKIEKEKKAEKTKDKRDLIKEEAKNRDSATDPDSDFTDKKIIEKKSIKIQLGMQKEDSKERDIKEKVAQEAKEAKESKERAIREAREAREKVDQELREKEERDKAEKLEREERERELKEKEAKMREAMLKERELAKENKRRDLMERELLRKEEAKNEAKKRAKEEIKEESSVSSSSEEEEIRRAKKRSKKSDKSDKESRKWVEAKPVATVSRTEVPKVKEEPKEVKTRPEREEGEIRIKRERENEEVQIKKEREEIRSKREQREEGEIKPKREREESEVRQKRERDDVEVRPAKREREEGEIRTKRDRDEELEIKTKKDEAQMRNRKEREEGEIVSRKEREEGEITQRPRRGREEEGELRRRDREESREARRNDKEYIRGGYEYRKREHSPSPYREKKKREESQKERDRLERLERERQRERRVREERERIEREHRNRQQQEERKIVREREIREANKARAAKMRAAQRDERDRRYKRERERDRPRKRSPKKVSSPEADDEVSEITDEEEEEEKPQEKSRKSEVSEDSEEEEKSGEEEKSEEEKSEEESEPSPSESESEAEQQSEQSEPEEPEPPKKEPEPQPEPEPQAPVKVEEPPKPPIIEDSKSKFDEADTDHNELNISDTRPSENDAYNIQDTPPQSPLEMKEMLPIYYPAIQGCRSVEEFKCLNRIEEGTYGVVYRACDKKTDEIVALKKLKMEKEKEGFPITSLREINTLLKSQHPNIVTVREIVVGSNMDKIYIVMDYVVRFYAAPECPLHMYMFIQEIVVGSNMDKIYIVMDYVEIVVGSNMDKIYIVMDYVEHDMKALMESMKNPFLIGEVKTLMIQLCRAVSHLHDNWILHRDLKTSNLLLSHKGILKVGDFGLAREYGSPLKVYTPIVVTLWYRAPELLLATKMYSTAIDMWSVGCIFAEFLTMKALWPGKSEIDELNRIFKDLGTPNEKIWPGVGELAGMKKCTFAEYPYNTLRQKFGSQLSDLGFDLLNKFLRYNPTKRISAEDALKHEYFTTELPQPVDPSMFPTWPAKSEMSRKSGGHSPKAPSGGKAYAKLVDDDDEKNLMSAGGFHMENATKGAAAGGPGFSLKF